MRADVPREIDPVALDGFRADSRFRFLDFDIAESQGGTWARSVAQRLWEGEEFTLQIDSHMKFEPDWDWKLIEMLESMPAEKPLLSMNAPLFYYDDAGVLEPSEVEQIHTGLRQIRRRLFVLLQQGINIGTF